MKNLIKKLLTLLIRGAEEAKYQQGWILIILGFVFQQSYLWINIQKLGLTTALTLSTVSCLLILSLGISRNLLNWYLTLLYFFPFSVSMFLLSSSNDYTTIFITIISTLALLVFCPWTAALIISLIGIVASAAIYLPIFGNSSLNATRLILCSLAYAITFLLFAFAVKRKEQYHNLSRVAQTNSEKLATISSMATSIAHELRTPLRTITLGANSIKECLPILITNYQKSQAKEIEISVLDSLIPALENIEAEAKASFTFLNMLLTNSNQEKILSSPTSLCSIASCVIKAVQRYPFSGIERSFVIVDDSLNFDFYGNELLMIHVFFNLLKNALLYISSVVAPKITISSYANKKYNVLLFKDNGLGVPQDILPYIFDRFYSKSQYGSGIGLAFCKLVMRSMGGEIKCDSEEGKYTEFSLYFPKKDHTIGSNWKGLVSQNLVFLNSYPAI